MKRGAKRVSDDDDDDDDDDEDGAFDPGPDDSPMEKKRRRAIKKATPKEPEKIPVVNYNEIKIIRIQGRIGFIAETLNSVRLDITFMYADDLEKIRDMRMAEAVKNRAGAGNRMASVIDKYSS